MNFIVLVCAPDPRWLAHAEMFREAAETTAAGLRALGHKAAVEKGLPRARPETQILLAPQLLSAAHYAGVRPSDVVYNFEQVGSPGWRSARPVIVRQPDAHVWEYSRANADLYARDGVAPPIVVPLACAQARLRPVSRSSPHSSATSPTHDVSFVGTMNARRERVLASLRARGKTVAIVGGYGEARYQALTRGRLLLNVHYYETAIFEQVRAIGALERRLPFVSETSARDEGTSGEPSWRVPAFSYDRLADEVASLLDAPGSLQSLADRSFEAFARTSMTENLRAPVSQLASQLVASSPPAPVRAPASASSLKPRAAARASSTSSPSPGGSIRRRTIHVAHEAPERTFRRSRS